MVIYVDVVFIENFIINLFLLYITGQTLKEQIKFKRLILSSFIGAGYVIFILYFQFKFLSFLWFKILLAFIMTLICYFNKNFIYNLKCLLIFIFYSIFLAGMCLFLQFCKDGVFLEGGTFLNNFSYKKLMLALMIIYIFINRIVEYVKDKKFLKSLIYNVEIVTKQYDKCIKAFLDTGNELREPVTNLPVLIVEKNKLPSIDNDKDVFYIPYKSVNGITQRMKAFKPLYVNVYTNDNKINRKQVIIALCDGKLSKENDYNALLSRGIIQ